MSNRKLLPPAKTAEAREKQLIALAMDLAEERLRNGTATSQEVTHFLKLGTSREELEKEQIRKGTQLMEAKIAALASEKKTEELAQAALQALKEYQGASDDSS